MYLIPKGSYLVYIMTNRSRTLYTGVTNSLVRRVAQHKRGEGGAFTSKYKLDRLVYYQRYEDVHRAIGREKEINEDDRVAKSDLVRSQRGLVRAPSVAAGEMHRPFGG